MMTGRAVMMTFSREQVLLHSRARHQFIHTTTLMAGSAAKEAAESCRDQVLSAIAETLDVAQDDLFLDDGMVKSHKGELDFKIIREQFLKEHRGFTDHPDSEFLTFREATRLAYLVYGSIVGTGKYKPPVLG